MWATRSWVSHLKVFCTVRKLKKSRHTNSFWKRPQLWFKLMNRPHRTPALLQLVWPESHKPKLTEISSMFHFSNVTETQNGLNTLCIFDPPPSLTFPTLLSPPKQQIYKRKRLLRPYPIRAIRLFQVGLSLRGRSIEGLLYWFGFRSPLLVF